MTGTCTEGGWIWWIRAYTSHCLDAGVEAKTTKELFALYLKGTKWEEA